jgi:hypothetical protein
MRSRLICSLASGAFALGVVAFAGDARAEVTRIRISIDDLPLQDKPIRVDAKSAMLPSGARDHGPVPKSWRKIDQGKDEQAESSRCTDERRGSVATMYGTTTSTQRIWEANGKTWLDDAEIETVWGYVEVRKAERVPLALITDGLWGYRRKDAVVLVAARDNGFIEEGGFYECRIAVSEVAPAGGTTIIDSSPKDVNDAIKQAALNRAEPGKPPKWFPEWVGVERRILVSVSKSEADTATTLSLVIKKP